MSVTFPRGFRAAGVTAGLKASGKADVAVVVNDGPRWDAAGVFTRNRIQAAPVLWSRQVLADGRLRAVVLNSGGANACTGPEGFADTHHTAEAAASALDIGPIDVAVCSTGLIGERLDMPKLLAGLQHALSVADATGGPIGRRGDHDHRQRAEDEHVRGRVPHRRDGQGRRACSPRGWRPCSR